MVDGKKLIGLQYHPDKVIQALIDRLPDVHWNSQYQMACLPNNKQHLDLIFSTFKGVAWVNCGHFLPNRSVNTTNTPINIDKYRNRMLPKTYRRCPENFYKSWN